MPLGFVGTGTMGHPMARCLLEAGHALTVYDVRREATTILCEQGARWADNPCAVVEASAVVFTSLPSPPEVEQEVLDPRTGILAGLKPGGAYLDMTTNAPRVGSQHRRGLPGALPEQSRQNGHCRAIGEIGDGLDRGGELSEVEGQRIRLHDFHLRPLGKALSQGGDEIAIQLQGQESPHGAG